MKITGARTIPLRDAGPDAGWPTATDPAEPVNTLVEIETEAVRRYCR